MKPFTALALSLAFVILGASAQAAAEPPAPTTATAQQITRAGTQASIVAAPAHFTGQPPRIDPLWPANHDINATGDLVTFEPGAHSDWHTHPKGQYLVVESGVGLTQQWGKPVQVIRPGDVVWCPPGVKHWHGATTSTAVTILTITGTVDGKNVTWMEKVTDAQYKAR